MTPLILLDDAELESLRAYLAWLVQENGVGSESTVAGTNAKHALMEVRTHKESGERKRERELSIAQA